MQYFARELQDVVHQMDDLNAYAVKTASVNSAELIALNTKTSANKTYEIVTKTAEYYSSDSKAPQQYKVLSLIEKVAASLGLPAPSTTISLKLAAVVVADEVFKDLLEKQAAEDVKIKLAESQKFGREFFVSLLKQVI